MCSFSDSLALRIIWQAMFNLYFHLLTWVPEQLVRHCQNEEAVLAVDEHVSAPDGCGTQMGDTVGV